jgi:hypothetical protein
MTAEMNLYGAALPVNLLPEFTDERVIEYYDGPLLLECRSTHSNELYILRWCDADETYNRWMLFRATDRDLASYLKRLASMRELVFSARDGSVFLLDVDTHGLRKRAFGLRLEDIPDDYLPAADAMYDEEDGPSRRDKTSEWTILLGGHWDLKAFEQFPRAYVNVYLPLWLFGHGRPLPPNSLLGENIAEGKGGAAELLWRQLRRAVAANERPRFKRILVASPGSITLDLQPTVAQLVADLAMDGRLHRQERRFRYEALWKERHPRESSFGEITMWDPDETDDMDDDLLATEVEPGVRKRSSRQRRAEIEDLNLAPEALDRLGKQLCQLVGLMWSSVEKVFPNAVHRADFILSYTRRLSRLESFLERGLIEAL